MSPAPDRHPYVGRPLKRIEDPRLITGQGQYVEDLKIPGLAHLAFLRSPYAHARIRAIRTERAAKAPGVIRVVTAKDLPPLRPVPYMVVLPGLKAFPFQYLADGVVELPNLLWLPPLCSALGAAFTGPPAWSHDIWPNAGRVAGSRRSMPCETSPHQARGAPPPTPDDRLPQSRRRPRQHQGTLAATNQRPTARTFFAAPVFADAL